jgi:ribose/xylose/arabinose/galactoside ABC-type transport system permease subunit
MYREVDMPGIQTGEQRIFMEILKENALVMVLLLMVALGSMASSSFMTLYNWQNILINISTIGMLALGQTLVMLVRQVDLSVGSLMAFSPVAAISLAGSLLALGGIEVVQGGNYVTHGLAPIILLTLVVGSLAGLLNGLITVKARVPSLIVTLGMLYMLRGNAYILSGGHPLYFTRLAGFKWLGTSMISGVIPVCFFVFLAIGVLSILVLKYTRVGPRIYATGNNEKAAIYSGVNTGFWKIAAFTFSGFCAGVATLIYSSRLESVEAAQAAGYELASIAIVVIGGTTLEGGRGTMFGTILAALILGIVINIISLIGLVIWYQTIITGLIIIAAVFVYLRRSKRPERFS